ncbi:DUF397 domain-containing protein [Streptomyces sp. NPDC002644]
MDHDVYDGYDLDESSGPSARPAVPGPTRVHNGMAATLLEGVAWQKSRHSNSQGSCVEFARLPGGEVAVRNSRFPDGPALVYTRAEIEAMLLGIKDGEFDHLIVG